MQHIVCLDLEGTLAPEIWIEFAEATNIPELRITTRDEPDYDKLMKHRIATLREHGMGLKEVQEVISNIELLPGALEFMNELRSFAQVIILSDTFTQFANPVMEKMGWPTIFCNQLIADENGVVVDYEYRIPNPKFASVEAFKSIGYQVISAGDSHNDLAMIKASKAGFLIHAPESIKAENPDIPAFETYEELMAGIKAAMAE